MTSRTAKTNWISEHLPEAYRVRLAIAIYVLIAIVALVVNGWVLLGTITVAAVCGALYARYTENSELDDYVVDDGWRQQLFPVAGAFFILACFAFGGWLLVGIVGLIATLTVVFRRRYGDSSAVTETRRRAARSRESRQQSPSVVSADQAAGFLGELEAARDEALAAIDERATARERSLAARKVAPDRRDPSRLEMTEARLSDCEQQVRVLSRRLAGVEGSVDAVAASGGAGQTSREEADVRPDDRRSAIRLVDKDEEGREEAFSVRAELAASLDERREEAEPNRLSSLADLERSLEERGLDLAEREAQVKAMHEELEERTEQRETQIELRLRELEAREAQLSEKEHDLERYVAQAQNAIRRQEAESRHEV